MKYIVFCAVFAALVAVSVADNLLAESTSKEQRSLLSQRNMLERISVLQKENQAIAKKKKKGLKSARRETTELMFGGEEYRFEQSKGRSTQESGKTGMKKYEEKYGQSVWSILSLRNATEVICSTQETWIRFAARFDRSYGKVISKSTSQA